MLRHTQATQLLANGVDLKTVRDRMGHANGAITLNWYAHAIPENDQRAAQLVGDLFGSAAKPGQKASPRIIRIGRNQSESETFSEKPAAVGSRLAQTPRNSWSSAYSDGLFVALTPRNAWLSAHGV